MQFPRNLRIILEQLSNVEDFYDWADYDYEEEVKFIKHGECTMERRKFVNKIGQEPLDDKYLLRVFNQTNFHFATIKAKRLSALYSPDALSTISELLLYRQGKTPGIRVKQIKFGVRTDLPFGDVRREYKALLGLHPAHITHALGIWSGIVNRVNHDLDRILIMYLTLIGIHPLSDANGRLARIIFREACFREIGFPYEISEGDDGEFLRVGSGLLSTEYIMYSAVCDVFSNDARLIPGLREKHSIESSKQAITSFEKFVSNLTDLDWTVPENSELYRFLRHVRHAGIIAPRDYGSYT